MTLAFRATSRSLVAVFGKIDKQLAKSRIDAESDPFQAEV
jgi:hypothetical protein